MSLSATIQDYCIETSVRHCRCLLRHRHGWTSDQIEDAKPAIIEALRELLPSAIRIGVLTGVIVIDQGFGAMSAAAAAIPSLMAAEAVAEVFGR